MTTNKLQENNFLGQKVKLLNKEIYFENGEAVEKLREIAQRINRLSEEQARLLARSEGREAANVEREINADIYKEKENFMREFAEIRKAEQEPKTNRVWTVRPNRSLRLKPLPTSKGRA